MVVFSLLNKLNEDKTGPVGFFVSAAATVVVELSRAVDEAVSVISGLVPLVLAVAVVVVWSVELLMDDVLSGLKPVKPLKPRNTLAGLFSSDMGVVVVVVGVVANATVKGCLEKTRHVFVRAG
jgi:hypothetical protein